MKLLLTFFISLALSFSSFSQNGVYIYGFMNNAPETPVQIDVTIYGDSSMTQVVLFTEAFGNIQTQWFDLPEGEVIQYIGAGFYNCQNNYIFQSWNASEFDNLVDIPLYFNYCADSAIYGCTDSAALNYNPLATIEDNSCQYATTAENDLCSNAIPLTPGNTILINNSTAFQNEGIWGECWGFGQGEGEQNSLWFTFTTPDYPASIHLEAIYDGSNTLTDTQFGIFETCGGEMIYCDGNAGEGLLSAFDFQCGELPENTTYTLIVDGWNGDSGTCFLQYEVDSTCTPVVLGCTDPFATNYNPLATQNDGSCLYESECTEVSIWLNGNTDPSANYILWSNNGYLTQGSYFEQEFTINDCLEDGCYFISISTADSISAVDYTVFVNNEIVANGEVNSYQLGSFIIGEGCDIIEEIYGCTDSLSINYNPLATVDDGSCQYINDCDLNDIYILIDIHNWGSEISWSILNDDTISVASGNGYASYSNYLSQWCLADGCYTFVMLDTYGDGWNGGTFQVILNQQILASGTLSNGNYGTVNFGINQEGCASLPPVMGCTDPEAINFNPNATEDDGSCQYETNCTDVTILLDNNGMDAIWYLSSSDDYFSNGYYPGSDLDIIDCLEDGCYSFQLDSNFTEVYFTVFVGDEVIASEVLNGSEVATFEIGIGCDTTAVIYGCTDPTAINYNPQATIDDSSCTYESDCSTVTILIDGFNVPFTEWLLTSSSGYALAGAIENPATTIEECLEDGCYLLDIVGAWGDTTINLGYYNVLIGNQSIASGLISDYQSGSFEIGSGCDSTNVIYGCTDSLSINYNPLATVDDGSCQYETNCTDVTILLDNNGMDALWYLSSSDNYFSNGYYPGSDLDIINCLEDGCYSFQLDSNFTEVYFTVFVGNEVIASEVLTGSEVATFEIGIGCDTTAVVYGCTDPNAINYNPAATDDNGTCIYQFDCSIDFMVIPDSTGENVIWIMPTENILAAVDVLWDFGDGSMSTDLFPSHEYVGDGPFTLCLTATFASTDGSTCSITYCAVLTGDMIGGPGFTGSDNGFSINVIGGGNTVGLSSPNSVTNLSLWPNPTSNQLNIRFNSLNNDLQSFEIMDITGKIILEKQLISADGEFAEFIDVTNLSSGVYLFKLFSSDQIETRRFIITK